MEKPTYKTALSEATREVPTSTSVLLAKYKVAVIVGSG
jgi:hypothetical protein